MVAHLLTLTLPALVLHAPHAPTVRTVLYRPWTAIALSAAQDDGESGADSLAAKIGKLEGTLSGLQAEGYDERTLGLLQEEIDSLKREEINLRIADEPSDEPNEDGNETMGEAGAPPPPDPPQPSEAGAPKVVDAPFFPSFFPRKAPEEDGPSDATSGSTWQRSWGRPPSADPALDSGSPSGDESASETEVDEEPEKEPQFFGTERGELTEWQKRRIILQTQLEARRAAPHAVHPPTVHLLPSVHTSHPLC